MGNSQQPIQFYKSEDLHVRVLCKIVNQGNDLDFEDGMLLPHLLLNKSKKIKIVTVVGESGHGKSTIIELIASKFLDKPYKIFPTYSGASKGTIGIQYFITSLDKNTELVLFDCEGFENGSEDLTENHQKKLYLLIAQITRLSTITIHVSTEERVKTPFIKFLKAVDIEDQHQIDPNYLKTMGILSNFTELLNKKDDLKVSKSKEYPIFQKSYFFSNFRKEENQKEELYYLNKQSLDQLDGIYNDIKNLQFSSIHKSTSSFQANQNCKSLYEVLIGSMCVLKNRGLSEKKHFANIINLQLHLKKYVNEQISKMYLEYCTTAGSEINELFKSVPTDKYISIQIIQMILQAKNLKASSTFTQNIIKIEEYWKSEFEKGLIEILKTNEKDQSSINDEVLQQYIKIKEIKPYEIRFQETYSKNRGQYQGLGVYALGSGVVLTGVPYSLTILESTAITMAGIRGISLFGAMGMIVSGVLTMGVGLWLSKKYYYKQQKVSSWKLALRKKLISNINYLHLNCQQNSQITDNSHCLQNILKDLIIDSNQADTIISGFTSREIDVMVPLFYFNLVSKSLKKKNIQWMSEDNQANQNQQTYQAKLALKAISSYASQLPQSASEQEIKNIIIDVIDTNFTKQEKEATKGKNIIEQFNVTLFQFKNTQLTEKTQRIAQKCVGQRENDQDLCRFITCLLLLKLTMSDVFYSVLLSFFFPIELLSTDSFTTSDGIKKYFEFQDNLLNTKIRN